MPFHYSGVEDFKAKKYTVTKSKAVMECNKVLSIVENQRSSGSVALMLPVVFWSCTSSMYISCFGSLCGWGKKGYNKNGGKVEKGKVKSDELTSLVNVYLLKAAGMFNQGKIRMTLSYMSGEGEKESGRENVSECDLGSPV